MQTVLVIHGELRWLVVLVGAIAAIRYLAGWLGGADFGKPDRILMSVFRGLLAVNLILGLILTFGLGGGFPPHRMEHLVTMAIAIFAAHLSLFAKRTGPPGPIFRANFFSVAVTLALVVLAVFRLRGAWIWR